MKKILALLILAGAAYWLYHINFIEDIQVEFALRNISKLIEKGNLPELDRYISQSYADADGYDRASRLSWIENQLAPENGVKVDLDVHSKKFENKTRCHVDQSLFLCMPKYSGSYDASPVVVRVTFQKEMDGQWRAVSSEKVNPK